MRTILNNNPGIEYLSMSLFPTFELSRTIGQIVQHCLQLKELCVVGGIYDLADVFYLHGLSRLSSVSIESDIKVTGEYLVRTPTLPSLRHIGLSDVRDDTIPAAIEMISNWPQLESLALSAVSDSSSKKQTSFQTRHALRTFQLSAQISKLKLEYLELTDQDLERVLDGCPALSNLEICGMRDGEASFASLLKLAGTLTDLELNCEKESRYWTPQRLLSSLPKLKQFGCDVMDVDELYFGATLEDELLLTEKWRRYTRQSYPGIGGKPQTGQGKEQPRGRWICEGLQKLDMEALILSLDPDRNKAFMDQLSGLKDIREFVSFASYHQRRVTKVSDHYSRPASALCGIKATGGPLLRVPSLPSLRQVDLSLIDDDAMPAVIEIISNSPHLDKLSLTCDGVPSPATQDALQTLRPSPRLWSLELMSVYTTDQDLARILDECPALTNLCLFNVHVGEASLTSLIGLAGTLTHLSLTGENDWGYWTPRRILCSLPKLVEFCCSRIDIDEMFFDWAGAQKFSASWKIQQVKERFQSEFEKEDEDGHVKDHPVGHWICRGLQRLDTGELILSPNNDRNQAFIHEWQQLQHLTYFVADYTSCRVLATQVSDFYPSSLKSEETPKMQGATRAAETNICLDRRSLLQNPKLQCIPEIWPKIQSYRGPTFSRSMT
ncbi:hypothetical protein EMPS_06563 [Entomortierella parvispora]|uniref:F-box domain-containing protein n=1 Tax=Entomortierella parvispora TaxID=205924 RepID=A0A9P3HCH9_9FUNG|nr:hypothetical protein EMPS_06563 [Entomortierella parvispora]